MGKIRSNIILREGSKGQDVKRLQTILNKVGLNCGSADGVFGARTTSAVKSMQRTFGLPADGLAGPKSLVVANKLESVNSFKLQEFACKHCGEVKLDIELLLKLEELKVHTGPLSINSGYRCPTHNRNVGGASNSQHLKGTAADIRSSRMSPNQVHAHANRVFKSGGVGKYRTFTHVDVRQGRRRWNG